MKKFLIVILLIGAVCTVSCNKKKNQQQAHNDDVTKEVSRVSVIYFSQTGNTKKVANDIAATINSKIYEIIPEIPYTMADVDYKNPESRVSAEFANSSIRPQIKNDLREAVSSDVIVVGYPIWKNAAPNIVYTFFDKYDLTGKKVYLFCTSGSSQIKNSMDELKKSYPNLTFVDGMRFESDSEKTIKSWSSRIK